MQARLKVLHDKANVKQVKLLPVTLIGRSTECNLKIASSQVSRNHCRITLGVDSVFVEDLGSANGTLVDGQPLPAHQPTAIAPGTHLIVGPAEFQIDYVASTSATMVLPRTGYVPQPDLPSTEMIFPAPVARAPAEEPTLPATSHSTETVAAAPAPSIPTAIAVAPVAAIPVAVAPVAVAAAVVAQAAVSSAPMEDTALTEPDSFNFGATADPEASEATQFMFQETAQEEVPTAPAPAAKKPGLKSLFSLFGKKEKPVAETAVVAEAAVPAAAVPSVFLPTVETVEPQVAAAVPEETPAEASGEFSGDDSTQTVSEGDDSFQQFLSQF